MHYTINEVFYSLQGEGVRAGTANVFVRFTGCNMRCAQQPGAKSPGGFDCDTEFESGRKMTLEDILEVVKATCAPVNCKWLILTGGEPGLQVDAAFCNFFHQHGYKLAIETNGSIELPRKNATDPIDVLESYLLDWITVSPKVAEHCIRQVVAHEVKYVRGNQQAIPKPTCKAVHQLISPAFNGQTLDRAALDWCFNLALINPEWRLSVQAHKQWNVR